MRLLSLLVPAHMPAPYPGATPTPYGSQKVDAWEREIAQLSPLVIRNAQTARLTPALDGRFVSAQTVTLYDFELPDGDAALTNAADIIASALKAFNLEKITVIFDGCDAADFDAGALENMRAGIL